MKFAGRQKSVVFLLGTMCFFVLALLAMIFLGRRPTETSETEKIKVVPKAQISMNKMEQVFQKDGITQWKLRAESAMLLQKEHKAVLENVNAVFYAEDGQQILLTSDRGELDTQTRDISLSGSVVIRRGQAEAKTHSLHYEKKHHILRSVSGVHFSNGESTIQADSMTIKLAENKLIFWGHVTGRLYEIFHRS